MIVHISELSAHILWQAMLADQAAVDGVYLPPHLDELGRLLNLLQEVSPGQVCLFLSVYAGPGFPP